MKKVKNKRPLSEKKKKNNDTKQRGIFLETYAVAPAPSRDYYALHVFQKKFQWTRWRICHGPYVTPIQKIIPFEDYKKDVTLQNELTYIFGQDTTCIMNDIAYENWSLISMPSSVIQKILSYISVPEILRLSQVSKRLSKECSSNELWKAICKKQWKILLHTDVEKASLIGWKTVFLEKMKPKRYKTDPGYHQPKLTPGLRNRISSLSTLNSPDSRSSVAKSNLTIPKRVQELKQSESLRSSSELFGRDFKVTSVSTGKMTDKTFNSIRGKTYSRNSENSRNSGEKLPVTSRKYLQQSSCSTINLVLPLEKQVFRSKPSPLSNPVTKPKVTSIRARSAVLQSVQPTSNRSTKLRTDRSRPNTGLSTAKKP